MLKARENGTKMLHVTFLSMFHDWKICILIWIIEVCSLCSNWHYVKIGQLMAWAPFVRQAITCTSAIQWGIYVTAGIDVLNQEV